MQVGTRLMLLQGFDNLFFCELLFFMPRSTLCYFTGNLYLSMVLIIGERSIKFSIIDIFNVVLFYKVSAQTLIERIYK